MLTNIQQITKMVGLFAILVAVILFPPSSAHAGKFHGHDIAHQTGEAAEHHDAVGKSKNFETNAQTDGTNTTETDSHDNNGKCGSTTCISVILLGQTKTQDLAVGDNHVSLPFFGLASAKLADFLRPPNL